MGQDDLRGYDGMLFRFEVPRVASFYMYRTTIPLSIAWFGPDGSFVSSADMAPCPADEASLCPSYLPAGVALHALEVAEGDLDRLGVGPGSTLVVHDEPC
jgi:hypothetical protein